MTFAADLLRAPGRFIQLEGHDGVGKTTQAMRLTDTLAAEGHDVLYLREPGGTALGDSVRQLVLHGTAMTPTSELLLFMAARAELYRTVIVPALARGALVIADRGSLSTFAYQVAGRGLRFEDVLLVDTIARGHLVPDIVVFLTVPAAERAARMHERRALDRMESEARDFQDRVEAAYEGFPSRTDLPFPITTVNGVGTADAVAARIRQALARILPAHVER